MTRMMLSLVVALALALVPCAESFAGAPGAGKTASQTVAATGGEPAVASGSLFIDGAAAGTQAHQPVCGKSCACTQAIAAAAPAPKPRRAKLVQWPGAGERPVPEKVIPAVFERKSPDRALGFKVHLARTCRLII